MFVQISLDRKYAALPNGRHKADLLVVCDHPDCAEAVFGRRVSRTRMMVRARERGWSLGRWDLCPKHKGLKPEEAAGERI